MLASLPPRSPSVLSSHRRSHTHALHYSGLTSPRSPPSDYTPMEGTGARRYTTPPSMRPGPPYHHASTSYAAEGGTDSLEQRPSPQSRQRSWHHPYMQSGRSNQGPSPPVSLEPGVGPMSRAYDHGHPEAHHLAPRHRSPTYHSEQLPAAESRPLPRGESIRAAQPLNISARPHPMHDVERVGGIGPSRNRGRSSTLSLPHPDNTRGRGNSFFGGRGHGAPYGGLDEPVAPPRSWEEGRLHRDAHPHHTSEAFMAHRQSPSLRPASRHSPILFAPLSPGQDPQLHHARRTTGQVPSKLATPGMIARGGQYRSRPGTPISPLNMENLSMEEGHLPSASGMAVPVAHGQQRSPAEMRARNDYFGPGAAEWGRSSQQMDMSGSPPTGSSAHGPRHDPREYPHRSAATMHVEGVSPEHEHPRYHHQKGPPGTGPPHHMHPVRAPHATVSAHQPPMSRMEQIERERYAMSQHHAPHHATSPGAFMGHGVPHEHGYQSEFAPQQRHGPGNGFNGNATQHAVPVDRIAHSRRRRRPPYSYSSMITQAIASSPEGRMTLREIYTWISTNFSGYPMSGPDSQGWQNTVRHNLSLGKIFIKKARTAQDIYDSCSSGNPSQSQAARGKGGWWTLHPVVLQQIRSGQRTHNDEFDDVERLVEIENAAAASNAASATAASGASSMTATSSAASTDSTTVAPQAAGETGKHKSLTRQRSYSDSIDPTTVDSRRPGSSHQSSTAPVSRKGSLGASRSGSGGRSPYSPYSAHPADRKASGSSGSREDLPSVLQPSSDVGIADRPGVYGRLRGHTIAMHDVPSQQRSAMPFRYAPGDPMEDAHRSMRPPSSASQSSPRPLFQARNQLVEDVEMESSVAQHKDSSVVLQEARENLVSNKQHQKQMMQAQMTANADADAQDGPGRMAIRGLLNS